jgi:uncharacterized repeat protein (TIGR01451 family)
MEDSTVSRVARRVSRGFAFCLLVAGVAEDRLAHAGNNFWTLHGPEGGWIQDAEFHPTDPTILYAAAPSGVYRSTDSGVTWQTTQDDFSGFPADIVVSPTNPDRLLLAAANSGYVSTNAGSTFFTRASTAPLGASFRVEISRDGQTAYIADGTRIRRSTDQGETWEPRASIPGAGDLQLINALEIDPADSNIVYASIFGLGIWRSVDGGASWSSLTAAFPDVSQTQNLILDPANPQRILAATQKGLFISDNAGASWSGTAITDQLSDVDVDPASSDVIYVTSLTGEVRKSTDRGGSWTPLPVGGSSFGAPALIVSASQSSRLMFIGGDGLSISENGGATWTQRNSGIRGTVIRGFSAGANRVYASALNAGIFFIGQNGSSAAAPVNNADLLQLGSARSLSMVSVPGPSDTLFAILNDKTLVKSADSGNTWANAPGFPSPAPLQAFASADSQQLYVTAIDGLYKSSDRGGQWTASHSGLPITADNAIETLAPASTPAVLYAALRVGATSPTYRIYKSSDAAASWSAVSPAFNVPVFGLTVHPQIDQVLYAGIGSDLQRSADGGATWSTVTANGSALCCTFVQIVFDKSNPRILYAVSSNAVLRSADTGVTWEPLGNGVDLPNVQLTSLALDSAQPSTLLLGTVGLGIRKFTVAPDLELTLTPPGSLTQNTTATYTMTLRNRGELAATNVRVTANLPPGATPTAPTGSVITWSFDVVRGLATSTLSFNVAPTAAGSFAVSASVTSDQPDFASDNNNVGSSMNVAAAAPPPTLGGGGGGAMSIEVLLLLAAALLLLRLSAKTSRGPASASDLNVTTLAHLCLLHRPCGMRLLPHRTPRPTSGPGRSRLRSCRASSTICTAVSEGTLPASPPKFPDGRAQSYRGSSRRSPAPRRHGY